MIAAVAAELGLLGWFKYAGLLSVNVDNVVHHLGLGDPLPVAPGDAPGRDLLFHLHGPFLRHRHLPGEPRAVAVAGRGRLRGLLPAPCRRADRARLGPASPDPAGAPARPAAHRLAAGRVPHLCAAFSRRSCCRATSPPRSSTRSSPTRTPTPSLEVLLAIYGYAVQIYCDFSGYTDIAIGCALLLGFRFPENFNAPYTARSLQDFWRRWHMTLSSWLRDYLYIPLGGNHGSRGAMYRNIMITMVLGGLWHGAAWTFVAWGAYHGLGQCMGHYRRARRVRGGPRRPTRRPLVDRLGDGSPPSSSSVSAGSSSGRHRSPTLSQSSAASSPAWTQAVAPRQFRCASHLGRRDRVPVRPEGDSHARPRGVLTT